MAETILFDGEMSHDYHQVYLCDSSLPDLPNDYSDEAIADRVSVAPEAIVIHVEREMPVPFRIALHDQRPAIDLTRFDHVVEAALTAPSGRLVLAGLLAYAPEALHVNVPAGSLGVVVTFAALGSLSDDGLEGDDRYAIHLWPDPDAAAELTVLKRWRR